MSLKSFHILFVTFTFLLSLFFMLWSKFYMEQADLVQSVIFVSGIAGLIFSPLYGIYFWKKTAKIIL
jgi:hypothetical protein